MTVEAQADTAASPSNTDTGVPLDENKPLYTSHEDQGSTDAKVAEVPSTNALEVKPDSETGKSESTLEVITEDGEDTSAAAKGEDTQPAGEDVVDYGEFKLPEQQTMDQTALDAFIPLAQELKLPKEAAQKVIDIAAGMMDRVSQQAEQAIEQQETNWRQEIVKDPEIGGVKQAEAVAAGERALSQFDDGGLRELLTQGRLTNNPAIRRFLARVGQAVSEDVVVTGSPSQTSFGFKDFYNKSDHK